MTKTFGDAFYFVALLNKRDSAHRRAVEFSEGYTGIVVTTQWVLAEVANTFHKPTDRTLISGLLLEIAHNDRVVVLPASNEQFEQGSNLFINRPDKSWSLTDCISFVVMNELQIQEALTGDHHFAQAGFVPLLAGD